MGLVLNLLALINPTTERSFAVLINPTTERSFAGLLWKKEENLQKVLGRAKAELESPDEAEIGIISAQR